jgi:predicted AAA+ superfamily ATPase
MIKRLINIPPKQSFFLLGARQTGKTTLVSELFRGREGRVRFISLAEEDKYFAYLKDPSRLRRELERDLERNMLDEVCIDEVQRVPALLNEVQSLIDRFSCRFILTGSSARKLKRGGANLLGGRALIRELFPLTAVELGVDFDLEKALSFGTLPRVWQAESNELRRDLLDAYVRLYLREEIQAEGLVRNLPAFSRFLDVAAQHSGELLNYAAIGSDVGLPGRTIQSYFELLEETLVAIRLPPFERSVRRRLRKHDKIYFFDTGVLNALQQTISSASSPLLRGRLFEHFIILETKRLLSYARAEVTSCFWRTKDDDEVDLVLTRSGDPVLACEIKSSKNITPIALKGLRSFASEHPHVDCIVVAPVDRSFVLENVEVLSVGDYFERLRGIG